MLTQDESFLQEIDIDDVEKDYWIRKPKVPKLETNSAEGSVKRSSSPELFVADDFENDLFNESFPLCVPPENSEQPVLQVQCSYDNADNNKNEKPTLMRELYSDSNQKDIDNPNNFMKCGLPLKEKIKMVLLHNAHKSSSPLKPTLSEGLPQSIQISNAKDVKNMTNYFELGPFYGLPSEVKSLIRKIKGITNLYAWQEECLSLPAVKERRNLVYSLPTSGGKTLVSEILMLRELLCRKKNVIFVLPYVSIVQEKVRSLAPFGVDLGFIVEEYAAGKGTYPPRKRRRKQVLFVATIEKAHGLINSLIEEGRLAELGLVVVDELHLVGEKGGRGSTLESLIIKLLYTKENIHMVGMSATIGNINEIAEFLHADIFHGDFRPVELMEFVKLENSLWEINRNGKLLEEEFKLSRKIQCNYTPEMLTVDPDQIGGLVAEVIPSNSCLVFCPTKKSCENVAVLICRFLPREILDHRQEDKKRLYKAVVSEGNGSVCSILRKVLPYGIAYHHSGLTPDERGLIEEAYRIGTLSCICCTSTLAAGVNLPAKRVILRSPYIGNQFISLSRYKQMIGRAGRAGFDSHGESILICQPKDMEKVRELLKSSMDEAISALDDNNGKGSENLVLSAIDLGLASSRNSLQTLFSHSLLHVQSKRHGLKTREIVDKSVTRLMKAKMLTASKERSSSLTDGRTFKKTNEDSGGKTVVLGNNTTLLVSKLGRAAIKGCIDLSLADQLYKDLRQAQSGLVLLNVLHLLYLVTPYDLVSTVKPIPNIYFKAFMDLSPEDLQTAHVLGISEACIVRVMTGKSVKSVSKNVLNRFYITLMLKDLWNQVSVWEVSQKYETNRGIVQSLMNRAAAFASCVFHFCKEFEEFWAFQDLLTTFSQRLSHCCHAELLPLMDLPAVKRGRARQLYSAGFKSLNDIAKSSPESLVALIDHMPKKVAHQIIAAAKLLLLEKAESLREEADDVMEGLNS